MERSNILDQVDPPTPAFVFDVPKLDKFVTRFQQALATHWPNSILSYSFKTNSLPWLLSYMRQRQVWAEVVSDTEYELALALGYTPDRIVFNGPIKGRDRLWASLCQGSVVNLDAKREVAWTVELASSMPERQLAVGLRVNWDLNSRCPDESTSGSEDSRFGFNPENGELGRAIAELTAAGVRIAGLHMHRNSLSQSLCVYKAASEVAAAIITQHGLELDWVDVGGGFFGHEDGHPSFADYVTIIRETLEPVVDIEKTKLIVEPGASLVAVPLEFHASVLDVRDINSKTYVVTNASRTNIDPLFRRKRPFQHRLDTAATTTRAEQIIGGFTCMEDDRLMRITDAPALEVGDRIVFYKVGGYTMCYQAHLFIQFPPAVYARTEDGLTLIRSSPTIADHLRHNHWIEPQDAEEFTPISAATS